MQIFKIWIVLISVCFINVYGDDDYEKEHYKYLKHHSYKNLDYLDLSSQQSHQIRQILLQSKKSYQLFYKEKTTVESQLRKLLQEDVFNAKKYLSLKSSLYEKALELEVQKLSKIHRVLTQKQRKKFSYFLEEWEIE